MLKQPSETGAEVETYNGWKNYPTWAVNLWLSNDEGLYNLTRERVAETVADPPHTSEYWTDEQTRRFNVADMLKDLVEEMAEKAIPEAAMASDLLGYALELVDWHEIAEALS